MGRRGGGGRAKMGQERLTLDDELLLVDGETASRDKNL